MAKLWAKVNGTWVSLGAQDKADVGLGNVENFTHTNSATDGSSSKYATGSAVKQAYDRATQALNKANSAASFGSVQLGPEQETGYSGREHGLVSSFLDVAKNRSDTFLCGLTYHQRGSIIKVRARYRRIKS